MNFMNVGKSFKVVINEYIKNFVFYFNLQISAKHGSNDDIKNNKVV